MLLDESVTPFCLSVGDATENELYGAMDWLYERQEQIEKKLASLHLNDGGIVLYDVTNGASTFLLLPQGRGV
jgi:hypothetical protein